MEKMSKETLDDLREKNVTVHKWLDEPQDKPWTENSDITTKNQALSISKEITDELQAIIESQPKKLKDVISRLITFYLKMVRIYFNKETSPLLCALSQLLEIFSPGGKLEKSEKFAEYLEDHLEKKLGIKYSRKRIRRSKFFEIAKNKADLKPEHILKSLYTETLHCLSLIYNVTTIPLPIDAGLFCDIIFQAKLDSINSCTNYINWIHIAIIYAFFFVKKKNFPQARYYLSAASHILKLHEKKLKIEDETGNDNEKVKSAKWEKFQWISARVAAMWARYGMALLTSSRKRLTDFANDVDFKNTNKEEPIGLDQEILKNIIFKEFEKDIKAIEKQITDKLLLNFDDARKVFLSVQKWLVGAKKYCTFETHPSDYVIIVQNIAENYNTLLVLEDDSDRQATMHRSKIDILESVINKLNSKYYQSECREIWIALGITYSAILNIKWNKLKGSNEKPKAQALNEIKHLVKSGITNYEKFLDSLKDSERRFEDRIKLLLSEVKEIKNHSMIKFPDKNIGHEEGEY